MIFICLSECIEARYASGSDRRLLKGGRGGRSGGGGGGGGSGNGDGWEPFVIIFSVICVCWCTTAGTRRHYDSKDEEEFSLLSLQTDNFFLEKQYQLACPSGHRMTLSFVDADLYGREGKQASRYFRCARCPDKNCCATTHLNKWGTYYCPACSYHLCVACGIEQYCDDHPEERERRANYSPGSNLDGGYATAPMAQPIMPIQTTVGTADPYAIPNY